MLFIRASLWRMVCGSITNTNNVSISYCLFVCLSLSVLLCSSGGGRLGWMCRKLGLLGSSRYVPPTFVTGSMVPSSQLSSDFSAAPTVTPISNINSTWPTLRGREGDQDREMERRIFIRHWRTLTRCMQEWRFCGCFLSYVMGLKAEYSRRIQSWLIGSLQLGLPLWQNLNSLVWIVHHPEAHISIFLPKWKWSMLKIHGSIFCSGLEYIKNVTLYILFLYRPHESCAVSHKAIAWKVF